MMSAQQVCSHCGCNEVDRDTTQGHAVCTGCGSVLEDSIIVSEVQFSEAAGGTSRVIGQFVSAEGGTAASSTMTIGGGLYRGIAKESREQTLQKGKKKIQELAAMLKLNQHRSDMAYNFYKMAVKKQITRGRKSPHVIAACLYLVCRIEATAHMLLDFSDVLQINVYTLGKTYLALSRLLCINVPAIDPSLLIPRFAQKLEFGDKMHLVSMTAMRFVSRMKRDWMAVGRRPSGLCGAALLVASRVHNFCRTKKDIIKVVKVCESTLRKRLIELEDTPSGSLTIEQFQTIDLEEEADPPSFTQSQTRAKLKKIDDMALNENEIYELSDEIDKELETKSSKQAAIKEREALLMLSQDEVVGQAECEDPNAASFLESEVLSESLNPTSSGPQSSLPAQGVGLRPTAASLGLTSTRTPLAESVAEETKDTEELDLEGLDDEELDAFILTEEERQKKEVVWMKLNGEFLKEQEEKLKRRAEEEAAKPPKIKRRRRKLNINASTAGEAMEKMIQEKKLSSKINYEVLKNLANMDSSDLVSSSSAGLTAGSASLLSISDSAQQASAGSESKVDSNTSAYLPGVIDETDTATSKRNSLSKRSNQGQASVKSSTTTAKTKVTEKPAANLVEVVNEPPSHTISLLESQPLIESGPIEETGPIPEEEDDEEEEEDFDEEEAVSASQLLGRGYAEDEEDEDDFDYD